MENNNLALKIRDLRKRNGFSQEQLSEESRLSLRTIQRIEKGESTPRGDTLMRLTKALGVEPNDIIESTLTEDKDYLMLLNISSLAGIIFQPIFGIIVPFVMWILMKNKIDLVDNYGRRLIGFQIIWISLMYIVLFTSSTGNISILDYNYVFFQVLSALPNLKPDKNLIYIGLILGLILYKFILVMINHRRIKKGVKSKYYPSVPF